MQENKTFYLFVKGQKVEVSEEVYRAYVQPERKQRKRDYRAKDKVKIASVEMLAENGIEIVDTSQDALTVIIEDEEHATEIAMLSKAISKLSERDQQVINLYYFEGKTQTEIAEILGVSQPAVLKMLKRILVEMANYF